MSLLLSVIIHELINLVFYFLLFILRTLIHYFKPLSSDEYHDIRAGETEKIVDMIRKPQKTVVPMLKLDTSLEVDMNNDKVDKLNDNSFDNSRENDVLLPEESKRSVNLAVPKLKEVIIPVYIKGKPRRRNFQSVFTR